MLYEHELRVRLRERRNRLYRAGFQMFDNEMTLFLRWLENERYLAAMLREIESADIELDAWRAAGGIGWQQLQFPEDERKRAKICLEACRVGRPVEFAHQVATGHGDTFDDHLRRFVETFVDRAVQYLEDRLEEGGSVLGILERYKRRTEWFHQADLFRRYRDDTQRGEQTLDAHLREYLVDQGISYPFSQPRSPSGEADAVADIGGDDPLALEVKLFLPEDGKADRHIRQGFIQAHRYAADYALTCAYLVCFNLTKGSLTFEGDEPKRWPAHVRLGERAIFLISIDANPERPSASKMAHSARHLIGRDYLLEGTESVMS